MKAILAFFYLFLLVLAGCDNAGDKMKEETMYAAFHPEDQRVWSSLEEARKRRKYNNIIEVSKFANTKQTAEQEKAAQELYDRALNVVIENKWYDFEKAKQDGFLIENNVLHYPKNEFMYDGEELNPEKPEVLMFYPRLDGSGYVLVGVMFLLEDFESHGPQPGGHETVWHFHDFPDSPKCEEFDKHMLAGHRWEKQLSKEDCKTGYKIIRSPEMIHVWFVDHPDGRFASSMVLTDRQILKGYDLFDRLLIKEGESEIR